MAFRVIVNGFPDGFIKNINIRPHDVLGSVIAVNGVEWYGTYQTDIENGDNVYRIDLIERIDGRGQVWH